MLEKLRQRIAQKMERDLAVLERARVKASLLKLELRDKKDVDSVWTGSSTPGPSRCASAAPRRPGSGTSCSVR